MNKIILVGLVDNHHSLYKELLKLLFDGSEIKYLDVFNMFCDKEGFISNDYSSDGIHLNSKAVPEIFSLIIRKTT